MKLSNESVKVEMTPEEYRDVVITLRKYVEHCHVSLLYSEARENATSMQIKFATKNLTDAIKSYEMFSQKVYDMYEEEFKIRDRIPSLRQRF